MIEEGGERNVKKKITAIPRGCDSARIEQVVFCQTVILIVLWTT